MSKKGVSMEEKRSRLLSSLYEKKECFNLKEIEKIGKKCGIIEQTVKDVLQSLVDDSLVISDRIGSLNIFWALPSAAKYNKEKRIEYLRDTIFGHKEQVNSLEKLLKDSKNTDSPEHQLRNEKIKELEKIIETQNELKKKLESIKSTIKDNPKLLNEEINNANNQFSVWEDNICTLRQWIKKKVPGISEKDINNNFGLPNDD
ncbi:Mnd1 family protein [Cryptosporidium ryanae]|uniref:Mnd1 family protein n=1 Tax=Cryptosporidium ryanae TaxID=515981 RepID=UPI003519E78F|nr:Mnd1 family protein [Cryptosporidium ryanae]